MQEKCAAPDCDNVVSPQLAGPLCWMCEKKWMAQRNGVVEEATHLTELSAAFAEWCAANGQPNPYE